MAIANMTTYDAALKDNYGPGLRNALNNSNAVMALSERNDRDLLGRRDVWVVHTGRSNASGARAESGTLPTADRQRFTQVIDDLVFNYHTIKVTGPAKHLTRGDEGAFVRALESELDGAERDLKNDRARQVFGQKLTDGSALQTGVIGTLSADPGTGTTLTLANEPESVMRHFQVGMYVQAVNPSSGAARSGGPYEITAISASARTLTIGSAADAAIGSTDYLVRSDSASGTIGNTGFGNEINGLRHLVSSSDTYAGIAPASVPSWAAVAVGSSTTPISEVVLDQASEGVQVDGNGDTPDLFITEFAQRRKLASILQAQKRYDGREVTLKAGWKGLEIAQGTLVADRYCPTTTAFALTTRELVRFVGLDWTWDEDDGKVLFKALDGSDAVQARYKVYDNLEVTTRNCHAVITLAAPTF